MFLQNKKIDLTQHLHSFPLILKVPKFIRLYAFFQRSKHFKYFSIRKISPLKDFCTFPYCDLELITFGQIMTHPRFRSNICMKYHFPMFIHKKDMNRARLLRQTDGHTGRQVHRQSDSFKPQDFATTGYTLNETV